MFSLSTALRCCGNSRSGCASEEIDQEAAAAFAVWNYFSAKCLNVSDSVMMRSAVRLLASQVKFSVPEAAYERFKQSPAGYWICE